MKNYFDITGQTAFVTGASKGLGKMFAKTLGEAGANVFMIARKEGPLLETEEEFKALGINAASFAADVTDEKAIRAAVKACVDRFGTIDILVNNAGTGRINKSPEETSMEEWQKVIDININGSFLCAREVGKIMLEHKKGKIINLSSISGKIINKGVHGGSYDVSKMGIDGMTRALSTEWAKYNINVNAIAPGYFMTDPNKEFFAADPGFYDLALSLIPAGYMGQPEMLAGTLLYLASSASDYVHGAIIQVDGGYTEW